MIDIKSLSEKDIGRAVRLESARHEARRFGV